MEIGSGSPQAAKRGRVQSVENPTEAHARGGREGADVVPRAGPTVGECRAGVTTGAVALQEQEPTVFSSRGERAVGFAIRTRADLRERIHVSRQCVQVSVPSRFRRAEGMA